MSENKSVLTQEILEAEALRVERCNPGVSAETGVKEEIKAGRVELHPGTEHHQWL